jgi:trehalose synthase
VSLVRWIEVPQRSAGQLERVIGSQRQSRLALAAEQFRQRLGQRTIWTVSSTAVGGGVAEMLHVLLGYAHDLHVPIRWGVITGDAEFFALTKRLHNQIHGDGAGGALNAAETDHYATVLEGNAVELLDHIRPRDLVLLHDPQTAGLVPALAGAGARVAWRCHIGVDWENEATAAAWRFLRPYLTAAQMYVFSRREYVPKWIPDRNVAIIPPSIDPFAPKNEHLEDSAVRLILTQTGILDGVCASVPATFERGNGTEGTVTRRADVTADTLPRPDEPLVVQVSRWDRLKDMPGVMHGFAGYAETGGGGSLLLAGPAVAGVADDPEGAAVFAECLLQWRELPAAIRRRIALVTLPLEDADENAVMVNALQRHAAVIVQKSLAEGFGLTVAEGMWKARPVIGSAVGGIIDQIAPGTGILLPDPRDLGAFAAAVRRLLTEPDEAARMGKAAQAYIGEHYVGDLHLLRYAELFDALMQ